MKGQAYCILKQEKIRFLGNKKNIKHGESVFIYLINKHITSCT